MIVELPQVKQEKTDSEQNDACRLKNEEYVQSRENDIPEIWRIRKYILHDKKIAGKTKEGLADYGAGAKCSIHGFVT